MNNKQSEKALVEILRQKDKIREEIDTNIGKIDKAQSIVSKDFTLFHSSTLSSFA